MSALALPELLPKPPAFSKQLSASVGPTTSSTVQQPSIPANTEHPVDAKLERLRKDILPSSPYLLRLKARSAQYHARDRYYWRKDTHFDEDEEELQYLTFRQLHEDTLLHAHGQWDDGNGGIAPKELPSSQASSGRTPVAAQVAKKKISLADYQKLDKSKPRALDMSATALKGPLETHSQSTKGAPKKEGERAQGEAKGGVDQDTNAVETREKISGIDCKRYAFSLYES